MALSQEAVQVLRDLNSWWQAQVAVRPAPPDYRRPLVRDLSARLRQPKGIIEIVRGPRQVGKTTGIYQLVQDLLSAGVKGSDILFVRFDLEVLRDEPAALPNIARWFATQVRRRPFEVGAPAFVFLDEVHKLRGWSEEVKHLTDTFPMRMLLTGSSSVLVAHGGRESLAGRTFTTELPAFTFREVMEAWKPRLAEPLSPRIRFNDVFDGALVNSCRMFDGLRAQQKLAIRRFLERYYHRGGYPRLYTGEVDDDRWADYLVQTVFENVLGADIPDLFPIESPGLLRYVYMSVARLTGQEIAQMKLAAMASEAGYSANQPTVGKYLHHLADALLIREFRRYPLAKKASARVPAKITVSDLGVRNATFRGAPSLWESDPGLLGPLVETLVQTVIRDQNLQVHFFRERESSTDRRSPIQEVDFIAERLDGVVVPIEVKFRKRIDAADVRGLRSFRARFGSKVGIVVTRELFRWDEDEALLFVPLESFLLAF